VFARLQLRRHCAAEVLVVGAVGPCQGGRVGFEIEHLVAGVENDAAGAGALHDVDRTVQRHGPADEVEYHDVVVVLVQREAGLAVHVVGAVEDVADVSDRLAFVIEPDPAADHEEVDEIVIEGPRRVEGGAVDRVRFDELELVALRGGAGRRGGGNSERQSNDDETDQGALPDVSFRERGRPNLPPRYPRVNARLLARRQAA
jgi:hypothetical protein